MGEAIIVGLFIFGLTALAVYLWGLPKRRARRNLIDIMGRAIQHRNDGERQRFTDLQEWIKQAEALEVEAKTEARKLGPIEESIIEWLDRVDDWINELERGISILSKVIERIQELLKMQ